MQKIQDEPKIEIKNLNKDGISITHHPFASGSSTTLHGTITDSVFIRNVTILLTMDFFGFNFDF